MDIEKLKRLAISLSLQGVMSSKVNLQDKLSDRLSGQEFVVKSVKADSKNKSSSDAKQKNEILTIEIEALNPESLYDLLSSEALRFFLASRISLKRASQVQNLNSSWQIVEHYYAAYYAAHYLSRIMGGSITNLSKDAAKNLTYNANPVLDTPIPSGLYSLQYNEYDSIITLTKDTSKKGGSHFDLWLRWSQIFDALLSETDKDITEYQSLINPMIAHKAYLFNSNGFNPSNIRGEINYQFKGGTWEFEAASKKSTPKLQSFITTGAINTALNKADPLSMLSNNLLIINLAKEMFCHISDSYPKCISRKLRAQYAHHI